MPKYGASTRLAAISSPSRAAPARKTATPIAIELPLLSVLSQRLAHEDGVEAGALELVDLRLRDAGDVRDRELAGGHVREQVEHVRERILRLAGGEHEELRVEALERLLELLLARDLDDELDTFGELEILVAGADDARVAGRAGRR